MPSWMFGKVLNMPLRPSSSSKLDKVIKLFCYCKGKKKWHDTSLSLPQGKQRLEALSFLETNCSSFSFTCKLQSLDFNDCLNQLLGYALCVSVTQEFCVCVCVCVCVCWRGGRGGAGPKWAG